MNTKKILFIFLFNFAAFCFADNHPWVDKELLRCDAELAVMNMNFEDMRPMPKSKHWVTLKIAHMVFIDQYMRNFAMLPKKLKWNEKDNQYFWKNFYPKLRALDTSNTEDLKRILLNFNWITVSDFGEQANEQAWLLVQHADQDLAFQKQMLIQLKSLAEKKETAPKHYAYLYDRVALNENKAQLYGTQGRCVGTTWQPHPEVEDFEHLDERRKSFGLPSFKENQEKLTKLYCQ